MISYPFAVMRSSKTDAGIRTIPLLDSVRDALDILREEEESNGSNEQEVDGYSRLFQSLCKLKITNVR